MTDLFSTDTMLGIIENLPTLGNTLTKRYFPTVIEEETEEIHFDRVDRKRRVAPFVHPQVAAKPVQGVGRKVDSFTPAYVKDLRRFNPQQAMKRAVGEPVGGSGLSLQDRLERIMTTELADQKAMLERRLEIMAVEALYTGKVTVTGDGYETAVVDFGRDATLTPTALSGSARWNSTAPTVLTNLRTWATLGQQTGLVFLRDVIVDPETIEYMLLKDAQFAKEFDTRNVTNATLAIDGSDDEGLVYQGTARGFRFYTYAAWYVNDAGSEVVAFGPGKVIMTSPAIEGVQAYGAIQDLESLTTGQYFVKSWEQPNPSARMMLFQSAPLIVPVRKNVSLGVQVY